MSVNFERAPPPGRVQAASCVENQLAAALTPEVDDIGSADDYRAVSSSAVAGLALGVLSPLALVDWWLGLIPMTAVALSLVGLQQTSKRSDELTGRWLAIAGLVLGLASFVAGQTWLWRIYVNELPPGYSRVSYAELQPQKGDPPNSIPPEAIALNGKKVLVKGYVYPSSRKEGITQFLLVRDQGDCCFGGNPKLTDRILVRLNDPKGFTFNNGLFKAAGTFFVKPPTQAIDATGAVFYHLEGAELR
ncbi:MAG: hypothetical protein IT427_09455 [Pirellulales bacterium]|nr:hypothetical protein [Pirellulales bacterium]